MRGFYIIIRTKKHEKVYSSFTTRLDKRMVKSFSPGSGDGIQRFENSVGFCQLHMKSEI